MPTLFRLVVMLGLLAGVVYAGMWALALFVEPDVREISTTVPPTRLAPR
ncbi:histidine kinase [Salinarimonas chemoclinalis]